MRELKLIGEQTEWVEAVGRTPPGVRELKPPPRISKNLLRLRRTPPGVRELKLIERATIRVEESRTPPGVRELKLCPI